MTTTPRTHQLHLFTSMRLDLTFDAAFATFTQPPPLPVVSLLQRTLSYKDKSISYQNSRNRHYQQDPTVCIYDAQQHRFPSGLLQRVLLALQEQQYEVDLHNQITPLLPTPFELPGWLYPHQLEALTAALQQRRGKVKAPAGSGKTTIAAMFIAAFPTANILMTVPTKDLLEQTAVALETVLQEPIGRVGDGKKNWQRVTVGIINSLSKAAEQQVSQLATTQVLVFDECHHAASSQYVALSAACPQTAYRIGLSATDWRESGDDLVLEGVIGPQIYAANEQALINAGIIMKPEYYVLKVPDEPRLYPNAQRRGTAIVYPTANGKPDPQDVYTAALVHNDVRNELIVQIAVAFYHSTFTNPGLILVERLEHGRLLQRKLQDHQIHVEFIAGQDEEGRTTKSKDRRAALDRLVSNGRLAIGSRVLNEGVNYPDLGFGLIASGGSSDRRLIQQLGRFGRTSQGKQRMIIVDFCDLEPFYLNSQYSRRASTISRTYSVSRKFVTLNELRELLNR